MGRNNSSGLHGKDIREPKITSAYYINLRNLSKQLKEVAQNSMTQEESGLILDLGCGEKPYQIFFVNRYDHYVGVDLDHNSLADVVACGECLPFRDDSFDACLCTEAYEHVNNPQEVTGEVGRVLGEDGIFILSAPGIMPIHNYPSDYWRWTAEGFIKMLGRHFSNVKVQEVTTPLETLFQTVLIYVPTHKLGTLLRAFINKLVAVFGKNPLNARLPKLISLYLVVAKKGKH